MKYDLLDILAWILLGFITAYFVVIQENFSTEENKELRQIVKEQRDFIDKYLNCTPKDRNSKAIMVHSNSGKKSCEIHYGTKYMVY